MRKMEAESVAQLVRLVVSSTTKNEHREETRVSDSRNANS
jgi:hypothetical protein